MKGRRSLFEGALPTAAPGCAPLAGVGRSRAMAEKPEAPPIVLTEAAGGETFAASC